MKRAQQSLGYDDLLLAWWLLPQEPATAAQLRARVDHHLCALRSRFIPDEILDGFKCAVPRA